MKKSFGEQIADHRKAFVMMENALTQTPEEKWETVKAQPEKLELLRYKTAFE